jgi:hypothetical protein
MFFKNVKNKIFRIYKNILYIIDTLANALTFGDPRETVSSVLGKMRLQGGCLACGLFCRLLNIIFRDADHCANAIMPGIGYGTTDNWGLQSRAWGNFYVAMIAALFIYRAEAFAFVGRVTLLT